MIEALAWNTKDSSAELWRKNRRSSQNSNLVSGKRKVHGILKASDESLTVERIF